MIITVDGIAASGKGTLARTLADHFHLPALDTGALWRALAFSVAQQGYTPDVAPQELELACHKALNMRVAEIYALTDHPNIRSEQIGQFASVISGFQVLRGRLDDIQRDWLTNHGQRGILDGRETGTSIAPHAEHKFFLFASTTARAMRRAAQTGDSDTGAIAASLDQRDRREITRHHSPVRPPYGATVIDTTYRSARDVAKIAIGIITDRQGWLDFSAPAWVL